MGLMERVKERIETAARQGSGGVSVAEAPAKVSGVSESFRLIELEVENLRLTRLVAELLIKNQRLRESN